MKKEDFIYGDADLCIENKYIYKDKDIIIIIPKEIFNDETIDYANTINSKYIKDKDDIFDYMLNNGLREWFGDFSGYSDEFIKNKMNRPQIKILSKENDVNKNYKFFGIISFLEHDLDEHIIEIEFFDELKLYGYVGIDG
ncbi:hypothetical protein CVV43_02495 [Candidatus Saccharibacteria bacterium HGW-Saccharibacteria-1]|jgi:hypothetical protein|nr:MAG: hypothetical protein CVV43_02495 [Candidatus Saccharibacteria bacterium HGW-Saccharibacteria-1]